MRKFTVTAALLFALHIPAAHADWAIGGYLQSLSFDQEKAQQEGVEDSALALGFIANNFTDRMVLSVGMGLVSYDDNEEFQQTVQYSGGFNDGDIESASSTAMGFLLHFDVGPHFSIGSKRTSYFAVKGGISQMLLSERSIGSCTNCYSEDIDINGGPYIQAALSTGSDRVGVAFQYTQYFDADNGIANALGFAVTGMF